MTKELDGTQDAENVSENADINAILLTLPIDMRLHPDLARLRQLLISAKRVWQLEARADLLKEQIMEQNNA